MERITIPIFQLPYAYGLRSARPWISASQRMRRLQAMGFPSGLVMMGGYAYVKLEFSAN